MCSLLKMCTPTLQMYTEKNHALYVHCMCITINQSHLKHLEFSLMAYSIIFKIIFFKFKYPCTGNYMSEVPLLREHQSVQGNI